MNFDEKEVAALREVLEQFGYANDEQGTLGCAFQDAENLIKDLKLSGLSGEIVSGGYTPEKSKGSSVYWLVMLDEDEDLLAATKRGENETIKWIDQVGHNK